MTSIITRLAAKAFDRSVRIAGSTAGLLAVAGWWSNRTPAEVLASTGVPARWVTFVEGWSASQQAGQASIVWTLELVALALVACHLVALHERPANDAAALEVSWQSKKAEDRYYTAAEVRFCAIMWLLVAGLSQMRTVTYDDAKVGIVLLVGARVVADVGGCRRYADTPSGLRSLRDLGPWVLVSIFVSLSWLALSLAFTPLLLLARIYQPRDTPRRVPPLDSVAGTASSSVASGSSLRPPASPQSAEPFQRATGDTSSAGAAGVASAT